MKQIILNYVSIFVLPILAGFAVRFFCRRLKKAWLVTAAGAVLTVIALIVALNPPIAGNEGYGLITVSAACATAASLITGLVCRLINRKKSE